MLPDPHTILGIAPGADRAQIDAAYRRLAMDHHPDRGGDPERMAAINAARDALLSPQPAAVARIERPAMREWTCYSQYVDRRLI